MLKKKSVKKCKLIVNDFSDVKRKEKPQPSSWMMQEGKWTDKDVSGNLFVTTIAATWLPAILQIMTFFKFTVMINSHKNQK